VVLEELVSIARPDVNGGWCALTSIRVLAAELGLGRDAVDAALRRLRLAGVVTFAAPRRPADGRFGAGNYVVSGEIHSVLTGAPQPAVRSVERSARRTAVATEQLGLNFGDESIGVEERDVRSFAVAALDGDAESRDDAAGGGGAVSPALKSATGGVGGRGHELASSMPAVAGDVGGDITGVSVRDGGGC
jgi:hypothetical protein